MRKASRLSEALEENYIQCYSILNAGQSTELQCFNVAKGTQSEVEVRKSQTEASEQCLQRTETRATGGSGKRKGRQSYKMSIPKILSCLILRRYQKAVKGKEGYHLLQLQLANILQCIW